MSMCGATDCRPLRMPAPELTVGRAASKGLRHFSMKVCEKVESKGRTTYNEVADELVRDFSTPPEPGAASLLQCKAACDERFALPDTQGYLKIVAQSPNRLHATCSRHPRVTTSDPINMDISLFNLMPGFRTCRRLAERRGV